MIPKKNPEHKLMFGIFFGNETRPPENSEVKISEMKRAPLGHQIERRRRKFWILHLISRQKSTENQVFEK